MSENVSDVLLALGARDYKPGDRVLASAQFVAQDLSWREWRAGTITTIGGYHLRVKLDGSGRSVLLTRDDLRPLENG